MSNISLATELANRVEHIAQLRCLLTESRRIVVLPHTAPDGDALGATLGLMSTIRSLSPQGQCVVISPDTVERYLRWLPRVEEIIDYQRQSEEALRYIAEADLILHLDHNQTSRLRYYPLVDAVSASSARKVLIDHHLDPETGFDLVFSYPGLSSTCELVYALVKACGLVEHISPQVATLLMTGIVTDTGRLMYACFYPEIYQHFSELMALGADYPYIIDQLSYHGTLGQLRLQGYALYEKLELYPELGAAIICLSREEMCRLEISKGDTEGLVNLPLSVEGIDNVCFIREDVDQIKLSMRSIGELPVNLIASRGFGGGGHLNAAGAEYRGREMSMAKNVYLSELKKLRQELKK